MASPAILYQTGDHASRPANGSGCVLYSCTDHDLVYRDDGTSWTTFMTLVGGSGGDIATDTIWNAAGDLAVGTGSDTAARLAIGAAGGAVSRINGAVAWNSGTGFPTAVAGDRFWRTDRGKEYFYDGTRWLTTQLLTLPLTPRLSGASFPISATTTLGNAPTNGATGDIFIEDFRVAVFLGTGNGLTGSHYWTLTFDKLDSANSSTTVSTITANSQTHSTWKEWINAVDAVVVGSAHVAFRVVATVTLGTPSTMIPAVQITYREVG
jgi:hypothetical protein